ncbi:MAG: dynamin family protein [Actinomycetota bacterium]
MTDTSAAQDTGPDALVAEVAKIMQRLGRSDLAQRASVAAARLKRPSTIVCVVGEFKQGKSSLINALLGQQVCPVDDDLATSAITLVRYADQAGAVVRRKAESGNQGDPQVVEQIAIADVHQYVSEIGNPGNAKGVDRVEIGVPSPLLKQGLVIVDTPGMGGLGAGHAAATMSFLPFADGLLFASDASAELSAPEVEFLRRATELCPTVLFVQTKIDLYPNWQRIMDLNRGHFERVGVRIPMVAVSSQLRQEALRLKDRGLNDLSRVPEVVKHLADDVVGPAKATAAQRSAAEALAIIGQVKAGLSTERSMLADPATAAAALKDLDNAKARLEYLRGPGAKWNVLVGDRVADLSNNVNYRFRASVRNISRMMDERIEVLNKGAEWDELARYLQTVVADEVTQAFVALEQGRSDVRAEVVELLRDEQMELAEQSPLAAAFDVTDMWQGKTLETDKSSSGKKVFNTAITTVRGAQGGIYMFGMLGTFLPSAAGVLLASNPVLLGIGAVFGTMGLVDDRKRKIATRRQAARSQVRQFLDDVQFEMGNQIGNLVREVQRDLRDEFGERLAELVRTYTETAQRAQADAQKSGQERQQRVTELDNSLKSFAAIEAALGKVAGVPA